MLHSGLLNWPWWGVAAAAAVFTHITIVAVTVFLHRCQAHRALTLHPLAAHGFRFWLWLTTGMVTRQWAAVHRKHHARCETVDDPHSPQVLGIHRVLWGGVFLYVKACRDRATIERYGQGTPDDWLERHVYARCPSAGVALMALIDVALFGLLPGLAVWAVQMVWIPFWAAGVVNGVGHYWGYRNWEVEDASTNIVPLGILIGGEELHNNHHAFASSAKLSYKWYEFDIGWMYIRIMQALGLAKVKKVAAAPLFAPVAKPVVDLETLQAVLAHRYDVWARYARSLKRTYALEMDKFADAHPRLRRVRRWLVRDERRLNAAERAELAQVLARSSALQTVYAMRRELLALWSRSTATREQLLGQLQDWCRRAEASGIAPLREFSLRLRSYAA